MVRPPSWRLRRLPVLERDDTVIDGGNSYYHDDIRRAKQLQAKGLHYVDVGTSGGVWGLERGYCQMIGGDPEAVRRLDPIFTALAPGRDAAPPTPGRTSKGTADQGYLHCVRLAPAFLSRWCTKRHRVRSHGRVRRGAEHPAPYANAGRNIATSTPDHPAAAPGAVRVRSRSAGITEVWRRGSVIASWLLDLSAGALAKSPQLGEFSGRVSDSGEGRWTIMAAIDESVPAPVLSAALYGRFASRGESDFAEKIQSAMRLGFGGHFEKKATISSISRRTLFFKPATHPEVFPRAAAPAARLRRRRVASPDRLDLDRRRPREGQPRKSGEHIDPDTFGKLLGLLRYIDGDYNDPTTFRSLRDVLGASRHPLHYLAIPPSMFETVGEQLSKSGCADGARVVIEKPFGRDLASAQELNRVLHSVFPESAIFRIDHYLGKEAVNNILYFRFANSFLSRSGAALLRNVEITMAEGWRPGPRRSTRSWRHPRRCRIICCRWWRSRGRAARGDDDGIIRESAQASTSVRSLTPGTSWRRFGAAARAPWRPIRGRKPPRSGCSSTTGAGRRAVLHPGQSPW
jgi:6-phosphogluconate dehydrogenase